MTDRQPKYYNHVHLRGNLQNAPEVRLTANGTEFVTFTVAVHSFKKGDDGKYTITGTEYVNCVSFEDENVEAMRRLKDKTYVEVKGRMQTKKAGNGVSYTNIVVDRFGSFEVLEEPRTQAQSTATTTPRTQSTRAPTKDFDLDDSDEIPF